MFALFACSIGIWIYMDEEIGLANAYRSHVGLRVWIPGIIALCCECVIKINKKKLQRNTF